MMWALLLGIASPPPAAEPAPEPSIVVVAERLRQLKLVTKTDKRTGVQRCIFRRHSFDAAFDAMMCEAVLSCAKTVTTSVQMDACLDPKVAAYAAMLRARHEAQR